MRGEERRGEVVGEGEGEIRWMKLQSGLIRCDDEMND